MQTTDNPGSGTYYYRAQAVDNGWAGGMSQTWNASILGSLVSGWSNIAVLGPAPQRECICQPVSHSPASW